MSARVLVADDSATMRKIIIRSLKSFGITDVAQAADGDEACALFEQGEFDLVLTDWSMPGKSGLEVLQAIRRTGSTVPVVLVATEGEKSRAMQAIQPGVSDCLVKPFQAEELKDKVKKQLSLGASV
ncbi:MAG: response regulator [Planctomycetota bacterium]|nr:MAG: response regulator [Planctomycetota bacterium]REJ93776.1 MAG: response regulator [Planctomycetota bacterium]REK29944.1 MAG: response regulator [Planctomycetota bacterium]REK47886.1 MAG: response regulator [Planctomycetota bacterium]